ncbi:MAG: glycosyltransferase [Cyanobacteria bacterium J06635_10]
MKIAIIVNHFPALSETFILNQITGLIERGHEVHIYADDSRKEPKVHPEVEKYSLINKTYYNKIPANKFLRLLKGIALLLANFHKKPVLLMRSLNVFKYGNSAISLRLLYMAKIMQHQQQSYDIIHCHFGYNGLIGVILRDIGAIQGKVITTFHGIDVSNYLKKWGEKTYDLLFQLGDIFLPISELWKRRLIELGCNGKIIVHRMGIDCNKFCFTPRKLRVDGVVEIVTVARLTEKKGVEYAIRAVAKLAKIKPLLNYTIVGDGPLKESLQQLIHQLGVNNIVTLVGWKHQQEVIEIIKNSDIMLAPSVTSQNGDREGIPVAFMETMAMGLPIISTIHSGIPELIENGVSGFLVPERDVDALAEKLNYLVENPDICNKMGAAGRAFVEEHYNVDKLNDKLVEIYSSSVSTGMPNYS